MLYRTYATPAVLYVLCYKHKNAQTVHSVPYAPILYHTKHIVHTALTYHSLQTTPTTQYDIIHIVLCYTKRTALHIFMTTFLRHTSDYSYMKIYKSCELYTLHHMYWLCRTYSTQCTLPTILCVNFCFWINTFILTIQTVQTKHTVHTLHCRKQTISTLTIHTISQTLTMDCAR